MSYDQGTCHTVNREILLSTLFRWDNMLRIRAVLFYNCAGILMCLSGYCSYKDAFYGTLVK